MSCRTSSSVRLWNWTAKSMCSVLHESWQGMEFLIQHITARVNAATKHPFVRLSQSCRAEMLWNRQDLRVCLPLFAALKKTLHRKACEYAAPETCLWFGWQEGPVTMHEGVERTDNHGRPHTEDLAKHLQLIWSQELFWFTMTHGSWDNFVRCPFARMPIVVKFGRQNGDSHKPEPEWGKVQHARWQFMASSGDLKLPENAWHFWKQKPCERLSASPRIVGWVTTDASAVGGPIFFKLIPEAFAAFQMQLVWLDALNVIHSQFTVLHDKGFIWYDSKIRARVLYWITLQVEMNHQKRGRRPVPKLWGLHCFHLQNDDNIAQYSFVLSVESWWRSSCQQTTLLAVCGDRMRRGDRALRVFREAGDEKMCIGRFASNHGMYQVTSFQLTVSFCVILYAYVNYCTYIWVPVCLGSPPGKLHFDRLMHVKIHQASIGPEWLSESLCVALL